MIYFIQAGENGPIKIGRSDNARVRLDQLQCAHFVKLIIMRELSEHFAHERSLHDRFAKLRLIGEWFAPEAELLAYIKEPVPCKHKVVRESAPRKPNPKHDVRVQAFVSAFGSIRRLSTLLRNTHTTTVRGWLDKGRIPHFRKAQLIEIAEREGVTVPDEIFA